MCSHYQAAKARHIIERRFGVTPPLDLPHGATFSIDGIRNLCRLKARDFNGLRSATLILLASIQGCATPPPGSSGPPARISDLPPQAPIKRLSE